MKTEENRSKVWKLEEQMVEKSQSPSPIKFPLQETSWDSLPRLDLTCYEAGLKKNSFIPPKVRPFSFISYRIWPSTPNPISHLLRKHRSNEKTW